MQKYYLKEYEHLGLINIKNKSDSSHIKNQIKKKLGNEYLLIRKCNCCKENYMKTKKDVIFSYDFDGEFIILNDIYHKKDIIEFNCHYALCDKCFDYCKKLNSNSFEYIQKKFGVSKEKAREIIHSINKSPFYKSNHSSDEDYKNHQNVYYDLSANQKKNLILKQNKGRQKFKEEYINQFGYNEWKKNNRDSSSYEHFLKKYDCEKTAKKKYNEKVLKCIHAVPDLQEDFYVKSEWMRIQYGIITKKDLKESILYKLKTKSEIGKIYFIENYLKGEFENSKLTIVNILKIGIDIFEIKDIFDFLGYERKYKDLHKILLQNKSSKCLSYSIWYEGFFFRSSREFDLYENIKKYVNVVSTNKTYYNSKKTFGSIVYYDLKIDYKGEIYYIELLGNAEPGYMEKNILKERMFGSILISVECMPSFIQDLKLEKEIKGKKYYECS